MNSIVLASALVLIMASTSLAQDVSPLKNCHVWLPMTGVTEQQMDDARRAGYDTIMLKIHPPLINNERRIDFAETDKLLKQATDKGFKLLLPILGWVGLGNGKFWDVEESGAKIPNQLDPFWPEAMEQIEWYYGEVIKHYTANPRVVGFAPTWGIYGEAGFTTLSAGRSPYALARFNEWRAARGLPALSELPTRAKGPNTDYNLFIRFRYLYLEQQFDPMIRRLKPLAGSLPVGMWQELYPIVGYLWTMVEVPSADFALYESCFTLQTLHHPEKSLGETMGLRYRCRSASDYRNYYLPLLARKRGDGQRFMGCQLSNDYAKNYGWTEEYAQKIGFDRWEDEFGPVLKKLLDELLECPKRDVLLIFPTYAAAALTDSPVHSADTQFIDTILRSFGCQMERYASPRLDKMSIADMDRFRLIVVPQSAYLTRATYEKLKRTHAHVVFTGSLLQALDGNQVQFGGSREVDGAKIGYAMRPAGQVSVAAKSPLTRGLAASLQKQPVRLVDDPSFDWGERSGAQALLRCGDEQLLSVSGDTAYVHGQLWAASCVNPKRVPPKLGGSADPSANEEDGWGPYDSSVPENGFGCEVMRNILDWAGVDYRVPNPKPRALAPYLGDHQEQISISANIVYNNTASRQSLTVRLPYPPTGLASRLVRGRYETRISVPAFSYVALKGF